jgi:uncharacterized protein (DUF1499 family)
MRFLKIFLGVVLVLFIAGVIGLRVAPSNPAKWHVDPRRVTAPRTDNFVLLRGEEAARFDVPPGDLAARLDAIARDWPRTKLLAGSVAEGWMTYVTRSRWMAFPDYTSVVITPDEGGARLAVFARARYGKSDLGVNAERLDAWLAALRAEVQ